MEIWSRMVECKQQVDNFKKFEYFFIYELIRFKMSEIQMNETEENAYLAVSEGMPIKNLERSNREWVSEIFHLKKLEYCRRFPMKHSGTWHFQQ